jgi:hypothetical protein
MAHIDDISGGSAANRSRISTERMSTYLPTLKQLQYLVALHEHGHFGRAADRASSRSPRFRLACANWKRCWA